MMLPSSHQSLSEMRKRIGRFLEHLTDPLFSPEERTRLVETFSGLTRECFSVEDMEDQWRSELCMHGIPMEFCLIVDRTGAVSLRQVIDVQSGPVSASQAAASVEAYLSLLVGQTHTPRQVVRNLVQKHLPNAENTPRTYVCHSVSFAPGKGAVARYYFNTGWMSRDEVETILSPYLKPDDAEVLRSLPLPAGNYFGTAYDIDDEGVSRVKVYVVLWQDGRKEGLNLAEHLLGDRVEQMERLLDLVSREKTPPWKLPQMLVGIGLYPEAQQREIRFCFPLLAWEWNAFRNLSPVLASILQRWGFSRPVTDVETTPADPDSLWRFVPTHFSPGISLTGESLGLYFRPVKNVEIPDGFNRSAALSSGNEGAPTLLSAQSDLHQSVFEKMFATLLGVQG